jgi:hypothetical protein
MPFFIATMSHPDGDGWNRPLPAYVTYLAAESSGHLAGILAPLPLLEV